LRLEGLEQKLIPVIEGYIKEVYTVLQDKPHPVILCYEDHQFKTTLNVRDSRKSSVKSAYIMLINTLYFRNKPTEFAIAHELEHWAQAQRAGPDVYIDQLQSERTFLEYEKSADEAALENAHKLMGKY